MHKQSSTNPKSTILAMDGGIEVELLNYGASLKSIRVPTGSGCVDVLLNHAGNEAYLQDEVYLGATVGRYAGRIDSGRTRLGGRTIQLVKNEKSTGHCLHGGSAGFSHHFWSANQVSAHAVSYTLLSADGDQGFPGGLNTRVRYRLLAPMVLQIDFTAETDQETIVNLSNHAYFNLNKQHKRIDNHELWINSDLYTPLGSNSLPTGEILHVGDSVFDFRQKTRLGERLDKADSQLQLAGGYDHFFLLNKAVQQPQTAAMVYSPESGIGMKLYTNQPGVQLYSGNWLGDPFQPHAGLCLEFQDVPNAPNMDGFPSTILKPGDIYRRQITMEFECD